MSGDKQKTTSDLEPLARKLANWQKLSEADRNAVLSLPRTVKHVEQHHYLVREFDRVSHACLLLSGFAIRHKIVAGGHRQIVAIHMKGEFVDLQNSMLGTADHSVQMLTKGKAAFIPTEQIKELADKYPNVGRALWTDTLVDGSIFREWIANVGRRDAFTRVAHLLCEFAMRMEAAGLGERGHYELPMTQEQLADATGLTSVHINRTMKQLRAAQLITGGTPRSIVISDWRQLADAGDFNSAYLHLPEGNPALEH
nr:Crp/Fnr family transcriptional regulator [uncultured Sphingomonas sp.]